MAIYLLDFENVHDSGINGVTSLTEKDELYIFYSVKSEHMSFETHVNIMKTAAAVRYIKLNRAAKNYLDFQLCTHLGYIIGAGFEGPFYIISKDTGYDSAVDYWKDHGVTIIRQPSIGFNRNQGKSTGQNPAHNTPPALVTFKQGNQVTTPNVMELYRMDTGQFSAEQGEDISSAVSEPKKTTGMVPEGTVTDAATTEPEIIPVSDDDQSLTDSTQAAPEISDPQNQTSSSGRKSRSRKSSSKKAAQPQEETAAQNNTVQAAEDPEASDKPQKTKKTSKKSDKSGNDTSADRATEEVTNSAANNNGQNTPEENADQVSMKPETLPESYRKRVRTALKGKGIPSAYYASIYKAILNSYDKLALNNLLVKTFGSSKGGEVYKLIKDVFTDFQS